MYIKRLKELREEKQYNQRYMAKILDMTQQQYSRYETGIRDMPIDILLKLSYIYQTSIDYIVGATNKKEPYPRA